MPGSQGAGYSAGSQQLLILILNIMQPNYTALYRNSLYCASDLAIVLSYTTTLVGFSLAVLLTLVNFTAAGFERPVGSLGQRFVSFHVRTKSTHIDRAHWE